VEDLGSATGTFLGTGPIGVALLRDGDRLQLGPNVQARFAVAGPAKPATSGHDSLTLAYDRVALHERLIDEIAYARRDRTALGVLAVDADSFNEVNVRYGRTAGDRLLCAIAARIRGLLGVEDTLARCGGDEFVVLAVGGTGAEAVDLAERVRRAVEDLHSGQEARITVSVGVVLLAEVESGVDPARELLGTARARLHRAQTAGANRVCSVE